jgi:hypothetical protein
LLNALRRNVNALQGQRWSDGWQEMAQPVFAV